MGKSIASLLLFLLVACEAQAQSPFTGAQPASAIATGCAAVNTTATATTATPAAGLNVYVTSITADVISDATGVAIVNASFTSTGLSGGPSWQFSVPLAIDTFFPIIRESYGTGVRASATATPVTVVSPAVSLHNAYCIRVAYWIGP